VIQCRLGSPVSYLASPYIDAYIDAKRRSLCFSFLIQRRDHNQKLWCRLLRVYIGRSMEVGAPPHSLRMRLCRLSCDAALLCMRLPGVSLATSHPTMMRLARYNSCILCMNDGDKVSQHCSSACMLCSKADRLAMWTSQHSDFCQFNTVWLGSSNLA
jgi:hypothetical protein